MSSRLRVCSCPSTRALVASTYQRPSTWMRTCSSAPAAAPITVEPRQAGRARPRDMRSEPGLSGALVGRIGRLVVACRARAAQRLVHLHVVLCHPFGREATLESLPAGGAVDAIDPARRLDRLRLIVDDEAADAVLDH